jgi:hypothetical protein
MSSSPNAPAWANAAAAWDADTGTWLAPAPLHERAEIRRAVAAMLSTQIGDPPAYPTDCLDRVYVSRVQPLKMDSLPAVLVYAGTEPVDQTASNVDPDPDNPGHLKRTMHLHIEAVADGDDGEEVLDRIALEIESVMDSDPTIGKRVADTILDDTTPAIIDSGEKVVSVVRLTYLVTYYTKTRTAAPTVGVAVAAVMGSWAQDIGRAHVDDYVDITDTGMPPIESD